MTAYYSNSDYTRLIATSATSSCIIAYTRVEGCRRIYNLSLMPYPYRKTDAEDLRPISHKEFMAEYDNISSTVIDLTINVLS